MSKTDDIVWVLLFAAGVVVLGWCVSVLWDAVQMSYEEKHPQETICKNLCLSHGGVFVTYSSGRAGWGGSGIKQCICDFENEPRDIYGVE